MCIRDRSCCRPCGSKSGRARGAAAGRRGSGSRCCRSGSDARPGCRAAAGPGLRSRQRSWLGGVRWPRTRHAEWFGLSSHTSWLEVAMLEVAVLRVLSLQAINRRTPCSLWTPVSPKRSGRPSKATYHHGPPTCTHWAATGYASRTGTASTASWPGSPAGCSWDVAARLCLASETTLRGRRTEWLKAGVFDKLVEEAIAGYDKIIGLDLSEVAVDGSLHKAPCGGEGTGPNPTDRAKIGWKWSVATDLFGIPIGWVTDGANRNDSVLLEPTLQAVADRGLLADVETLHLDKGYDSFLTTQAATAWGSPTSSAPRRRARAHPRAPPPARAHPRPRSPPTAKPRPRRPTPWACAGPSNEPTPGSPTSASSAATPIGSAT